MSLIRGVLAAGRMRTQHELNTMSHDDQRNTLIVEMAGRTNQSGGHFQGMDDQTLAGVEESTSFSIPPGFALTLSSRPSVMMTSATS